MKKNKIVSIPEKLASPVMEMVSHTRPDCLVVVTDMLDNQKKPVVVAIKPDGHGYYLNAEIPANIALSGYGKDGFKNYIIKAFSEKRMLYCDYAKSHQLQQIPGVQFPNNLPHGDFTATIAEFAERVKRNREAKKQNSVPRAAISNEEYWETNELNEERDAIRQEIREKESEEYNTKLLREGGVEAVTKNAAEIRKLEKKLAEAYGDKERKVRAETVVKPTISKAELRQNLMRTFSTL